MDTSRQKWHVSSWTKIWKQQKRFASVVYIYVYGWITKQLGLGGDRNGNMNHQTEDTFGKQNSYRTNIPFIFILWMWLLLFVTDLMSEHSPSRGNIAVTYPFYFQSVVFPTSLIFPFFFFNLAFFVQFSYFLIFLFYIFLFCSVYDRKTVACVYRRRTEKCRGLNRFLLVYNKKKEKACKLIYQIYVTYILIYLIQHYTWQRGVLYDLETIC